MAGRRPDWSESLWLAVLFRGFSWSAPALLALLFLFSLSFPSASSSESFYPQQDEGYDHGSGLRRLKGSSGIHKRLNWTFSWAAGSDGSCKCREVSWGEYRTEDECLRAFAENSLHACTYHGFGITAGDCKFAVSVDPSIRNSSCVEQCEAAVDGEGFAMLDEMFRLRCSIEKYDVGSGSVLSLSNCFTNEIHGHSDTSLALPIPDIQMSTQQVANVTTATECQELCQIDNECQSWLWRKVFDADGLPPHTCFFKSTDMLSRAVAATIPVGRFGRNDPLEYDHQYWQYCDLQSKWKEIENSYSADTEVCNCGCIWKSNLHLSGPKYCQAVIDGSSNHWGAGPPSHIIPPPSQILN